MTREPAGPRMARGNEGLHGLCPARYVDFQGSMGTFADPAVETEPGRLLVGKMAIADDLDKAFDTDSQGRKDVSFFHHEFAFQRR